MESVGEEKRPQPIVGSRRECGMQRRVGCRVELVGEESWLLRRVGCRREWVMQRRVGDLTRD